MQEHDLSLMYTEKNAGDPVVSQRAPHLQERYYLRKYLSIQRSSRGSPCRATYGPRSGQRPR
jgi:hypothetical protein